MYRNVALVPAYEPDAILLDVLRQLKKEGMEIVLVDDGSGPQYSDLFDRASSLAKVLTYTINKGKGAALKAGMTYLRNNKCSYQTVLVYWGNPNSYRNNVFVVQLAISNSMLHE